MDYHAVGNTMQRKPKIQWFTKGDFDAFIAVSSNNVATMLTCTSILLSLSRTNEFDDIVFERIIPGVGLAMLFGNIYYIIQAVLYIRDTGRSDICAQVLTRVHVCLPHR